VIANELEEVEVDKFNKRRDCRVARKLQSRESVVTVVSQQMFNSMRRREDGMGDGQELERDAVELLLTAWLGGGWMVWWAGGL
jgi:hypothetical protein